MRDQRDTKLRLAAKPSLAMEYLAVPLLAALFLLFSDIIVLYLIERSLLRPTLILVVFLEGGLGLLTGVGIALSSTPSVSRFGEVLLGTSPWSRDQEMHAEKVGWRWIAGSAYLILIGFLMSMF